MRAGGFARVAVLSVSILATGCSNLSKQEQAAIGGAVVGIAVGILLGKDAGSVAAGAIIGAAAGAIVGAAIGDYLDQNELRRAEAARNRALEGPAGTRETWQSERRSRVRGYAVATTDVEMTDLATLPEDVRKAVPAVTDVPDPPAAAAPVAAAASAAPAAGNAVPAQPAASPARKPERPNQLACRMIEEVLLVEGGEKRFGARVCRVGNEWVKA